MSGRARPFRRRYKLYIWKQCFSVVWTMCLKSILSEICVVANYPMWPQKEALNFKLASLSSASLVMNKLKLIWTKISKQLVCQHVFWHPWWRNSKIIFFANKTWPYIWNLLQYFLKSLYLLTLGHHDLGL